ncbi:hypothetical protein VST7929_00483 [Vibrio stylophorae]|uniref:Uncharacterized protein n=1 Tax=Vibrio stylophorae TaxID=659351 RepID=A0ABM8ZQS8_9VIBR|nr:hypothetical protein VST7929_00483 [Vibrio stylophorae]
MQSILFRENDKGKIPHLSCLAESSVDERNDVILEKVYSFLSFWIPVAQKLFFFAGELGGFVQAFESA